MINNSYQKKVAKFVCRLTASAIAGFFIFYSFSGWQNSNEINYKISANPEVVSHSIKPDFGELPLSFEANAGQTDVQVKFVSRGQGFALFLTDAEAVLSLRKNNRQTPPAVLRMRLDGANQTPEIVGQNQLAGKSNYFVGDNPNRWKTDVPNYSRVRYKEVYPGIDQVFYGAHCSISTAMARQTFRFFARRTKFGICCVLKPDLPRRSGDYPAISSFPAILTATIRQTLRFSATAFGIGSIVQMEMSTSCNSVWRAIFPFPPITRATDALNLPFIAQAFGTLGI